LIGKSMLSADLGTYCRPLVDCKISSDRGLKQKQVLFVFLKDVKYLE